ncbi:unnamed protein product [Amoebophrya sp. A120]|nr:unnamed protein product [Amoebophrya sp. A120]|eukprot:GSA120T00002731001.1
MGCGASIHRSSGFDPSFHGGPWERFVDQKLCSFPANTGPDKQVETFHFRRVPQGYATCGSRSGRNDYSFHKETNALVHRRDPNVVCTVGASINIGGFGDFHWSHGYASRAVADFSAKGSHLMGRPGGTWSEHLNIDMCFQGDVEMVKDWTKTHTIDDLRKIVEQKGYSAFTVSNGQPAAFSHAALKKFPFQLTPEHCKPTTYGCALHIYTPPMEDQENGGFLTKEGAKSTSPPVTEFPESPLILVSPAVYANKRIVGKQASPQRFQKWRYVNLEIGDAHQPAVRVRFDGTFLEQPNLQGKEGPFVFDVTFWKYHVNNTVALVQEESANVAESTRKRHGGRDFQVNADGTVSPKLAPHLVLGAVAGQVRLVEKGDAMQCVFEGLSSVDSFGAQGQLDPAAMPFHMVE